MRTPRTARLRAESDDVTARESGAAEHLRFIRTTMARAGSFTALSGVGLMIVGAIGLTASVVAAKQATPQAWVWTWLIAAVLSVTAGTAANALKARRLRVPQFSTPARRFTLMFGTPLLAGAILTVVFYQAGLVQRLPGTWLLLFGTGTVTGGALSIDIVPIMGACFIALAVAAFVLPPGLGDVLLAVGFGGLNLVFGAIIAVKHDG